MSENNTNNKIIQDIQGTGDEAARLLADLENSSASESSSQKLDNASLKLKKSNHRYPEHTNSTANSNTLVGPAIVVSAFILFLAIAASLGNTTTASNPSVSESNNDSIPVPAKTKKKLMTRFQRAFYDDTLKDATKAVLIREHKDVIKNLSKLNSGEYRGLTNVDRGLVNNRIIQAQKKIKFLDQPGKHSYWERANYGVQWFDKGTDNHFRVFFAYSKKCTNPLVTFRVSKESGSSNYKTYKVRPKTNISTLHVPFLFEGYQYINVLKFNCN